MVQRADRTVVERMTIAILDVPFILDRLLVLAQSALLL